MINLCLNRTTMILKFKANKDTCRKISHIWISKGDRCNNKKKCNSKKSSSRELRCSQLKLISLKYLRLAKPTRVLINNNSNYISKRQIR